MSLKHMLNEDHETDIYRARVSPPEWHQHEDYGDCDEFGGPILEYSVNGSAAFDSLLSTQSWDYDDYVLAPVIFPNDIAPHSSVDAGFDLTFNQSSQYQGSVERWTPEAILGQHAPIIDRFKSELVCYGMICRASIKLSGDMLVLDNILSTAAVNPVTGHVQLNLKEIETQYLVAFSDGHILGEINAQLEKALSNIKEQRLELDFEVFVHVRNTRDTISKATRGQEAVIRAQINVYGPLVSADSVGQEFSQNKLYLQRPDRVRDGVPYENPHVLKFTDNIDAVPIANVVLDEAHDSTTTGGFIQEVVADVYSSLTRNKNLKGLEGHERLQTPLLTHQKTALDFMSQRENGPIPEEYQLWLPFEREGQLCYRHAVTGTISRLDHTETGGGILADEMGMGKSLSMLALIFRTLEAAHAWTSNGEVSLQSAHEAWGIRVRSKATLIVASSDLMINEWFLELNKHFSNHTLTTIKYHGPKRRCSLETLRATDLVITTYHTLASESSNSKGLLNQIEWYRLVLDEAHIIRRQNTVLNRTVTEIQARSRWCLTGTPIQNRLEDIGSLFAFLRMEPLHNLGAFKKAISVPFAEGGKRRALSIERFTCLLDSMCLRRTKDLLHLPDPESRVHRIMLSANERAQYEQTSKIMFRTVKNQVEKIDRKSTLSQFQIQLQLRIICNHGTWQQPFSWSRRKLYLLDEREARDIDLGSQGEATCSACRQTMPLFGLGSTFRRYQENCRHTLCSECLEQSSETTEDHLATSCPLCSSLWRSFKYPQRQKGQSQEDMYFRADGKSSKMEALMSDVMKDITVTKSIIFTCWTRTLDLVQLYLKREKLTSSNFKRIDGDCPTSKREKILVEFEHNADLHVLIMTTGTGAVGLNLAVANRVFIVEPQWNPSVENQAIARALRLGQKQAVLVTRYVVDKSVEQDMRKLQDSKLEMSNLVKAG